MSDASARIPAGSQTVGPYFRIGLEYLMDRIPALTLSVPGTIELRGRVLDRDGEPVPDALLEFWTAATVAGRLSDDGESNGFPAGFTRAATDSDGGYSIAIERPATGQSGDEQTDAAHMIVLVFARGLLRHLISRVYLGDESANESDAVLMEIPEERRATLIARPDQRRAGMYWWDIRLQGTDETVFFAW
jgi:protocatechuate 3,4-dioxygenase, alpha subunit